jgi:cell division septal protein FtsQ
VPDSRFPPTPPDSQPRKVRRRGQFIYTGDSVRAQAPKQPIVWRQIFWRIGIFAVAALGIWVLFFSGWLNARGIAVKGNSTISQEAITQAADEYLRANPVQRNVLFLNAQDMAQAVKTQEPTLANVKVSRTLLLGLNVQVVESQPSLVWQTGEQSWLIAEDGRVLRQAKAGEGTFGRIIDTAQLTVKVGDKVADKQFVVFAREFISLAGKKGVDIESSAIGATTRELNIRLKNGIVIRTDTSRGAAEQVEAYIATIETAQQQNKKPTEYVDVRIPGKAFYK